MDLHVTPRGKPRKFDPTIPKHIDQDALPEGFYWDRTGRGRWRMRVFKDGRWRLETVAGADARLSDLHRMAEEQTSSALHGSIGWMLERFHGSTEFAGLAAATQRSYAASRKVVSGFPTRAGGAFGDLPAQLLRSIHVQALHEKLVAEGTPTKANHALRYLRRVYAWAVPHLDFKANPARGVKAAKERAKASMPTSDAFAAVLAFARERAARRAHTEGSVAPYLPAVIELAYALRLRGIEVLSLTDAHALEDGILANRRKGSRDNVTTWSPGLRAVWQEAVDLRKAALTRHRRATQLRAEDRALFVSEDGGPLSRSGLSNAFARMMTLAIEAEVIPAEARFTLHGLKHRGMTDGTDKTAGGHRTEAMRQRYDHEVPRVAPAAPRAKSGPKPP